MVLGRADRAEKSDDVGLRRKLGKCEHRAGIGRLIVLGDELDLA
jgi:hypothetical protein